MLQTCLCRGVCSHWHGRCRAVAWQHARPLPHDEHWASSPSTRPSPRLQIPAQDREPKAACMQDAETLVLNPTGECIPLNSAIQQRLALGEQTLLKKRVLFSVHEYLAFYRATRGKLVVKLSPKSAFLCLGLWFPMSTCWYVSCATRRQIAVSESTGLLCASVPRKPCAMCLSAPSLALGLWGYHKYNLCTVVTQMLNVTIAGSQDYEC